MLVRRLQILSIFFVISALLIGAEQCRADETITALTAENVTDFINKTTAVMSHEDSGMTPEDVAAYLDAHIESGARFKSTIKYNMPGYPAQENVMSLDKDEFMESADKGAKELSEYESQVDIGEINIASDGTKATVKTSSMEHATMSLSPDGKVGEPMPVEGVSDCNQIITLEDGVIQMYGATCTTTINFLMDSATEAATAGAQ